jgi:hypothetical protein
LDSFARAFSSRPPAEEGGSLECIGLGHRYKNELEKHPWRALDDHSLDFKVVARSENTHHDNDTTPSLPVIYDDQAIPAAWKWLPRFTRVFIF